MSPDENSPPSTDQSNDKVSGSMIIKKEAIRRLISKDFRVSPDFFIKLQDEVIRLVMNAQDRATDEKIKTLYPRHI